MSEFLQVVVPTVTVAYSVVSIWYRRRPDQVKRVLQMLVDFVVLVIILARPESPEVRKRGKHEKR